MSAAPTLVVLAAGLGTRLRPLTDDLPKCLVPLGSETPLDRLARQFRRHGVDRLVVVTGHAASRIEGWARDGAPPGLRVECVFNPRYAEWNNAESVRVAAPVLRGAPFVQVDGDLVVEDAVVEGVCAQLDGAVLAVDTSARLDAEAMKVEIADAGARRIRALGKWLPIERAHAEAVGIVRFDASASAAYFDALEVALLEAGRTDAYYEDVLHEMVADGFCLTAADVRGAAWTEIDDPADLARARALASSTRARGNDP